VDNPSLKPDISILFKISILKTVNYNREKRK